MYRATLVLAFAACGRIGFDAAGGGDAAITPANVCGAGTTAPAMVTLSGQAVTYTSYVTTMPIPLIQVTVMTLAGMQLATQMNQADGTFSLDVPTGGIAAPLAFVTSRGGGFLTVTTYTGTAVDRDVAGSILRVWAVPAMDSVYGVFGLAVREATASTITIGVLDCQGGPIEGATVHVEPAPGLLGYIGPDGMPIASPSTVAPLSYAVALNAVAGPTLVYAVKDGVRFGDQLIDVSAGDTATVMTLHPMP